MYDNNCTSIPEGSKKFYEAVERLINAPSSCGNIFEMATHCCELCRKTFDCESCVVQTLSDNYDKYKGAVQKRTNTGMYTSGIYKDKDGNYHYTHPDGSD